MYSAKEIRQAFVDGEVSMIDCEHIINILQRTKSEKASEIEVIRNGSLFTLKKGNVKLCIKAICSSSNYSIGLKHDDWLWIFRERFGKFPEVNDYKQSLLAHREMSHLCDAAKSRYDRLYNNFGSEVLQYVKECFEDNKNSDMVRVYSE